MCKGDLCLQWTITSACPKTFPQHGYYDVPCTCDGVNKILRVVEYPLVPFGVYAASSNLVTIYVHTAEFQSLQPSLRPGVLEHIVVAPDGTTVRVLTSDGPPSVTIEFNTKVGEPPSPPGEGTEILARIEREVEQIAKDVRYIKEHIGR